MLINASGLSFSFTGGAHNVQLSVFQAGFLITTRRGNQCIRAGKLFEFGTKEPIEPENVSVPSILRWLPKNTESLTVISAPNVVFEQHMFQLMNHEETWQFLALNPLWPVYQHLKKQDVFLTVRATINKEPLRANGAPYCTFVALRSNAQRDIHLKNGFASESERIHKWRGTAIYELRHSRPEEEAAQGPKLIVMPRTDLIIASNDMYTLVPLESSSLFRMELKETTLQSAWHSNTAKEADKLTLFTCRVLANL